MKEMDLTGQLQVGEVIGAGNNSSGQATTISSSCRVGSSSRRPQLSPKVLVPNSHQDDGRSPPSPVLGSLATRTNATMAALMRGSTHAHPSSEERPLRLPLPALFLNYTRIPSSLLHKTYT
jgi:hypothetical protein